MCSPASVTVSFLRCHDKSVIARGADVSIMIDTGDWDKGVSIRLWTESRLSDYRDVSNTA